MNTPAMGQTRSSGEELALPQGFQLAPLSTGQILDRTFVLYRSRFGLFAGLAVFPAAVSLLFGLVQLCYLLATHTPLNKVAGGSFSMAYWVHTGIGLAGGLLRLCVYGISIAATTWCIAKLYLGEQADMRSGFDFAFRNWGRYIVLVLAQAWFAFWLPGLALVVTLAAASGLSMSHAVGSTAVVLLMVVACIGFVVWFVIRAIRVSLSIPACVVEEMPIRAAIRRSRALLESRKFRIFLLFLFIVVLEMVFSAFVFPLVVMAPKYGPTGLLILQAVTLAISFCYGVLVSPIAAIALCLFYFDERVRREGFDIEFLMKQTAEAGGVAAEALPFES